MTTETTKSKKLALAITSFLGDSLKNGTLSASSDSEGIEIAIQCIAEAFGINPADPNPIAPASLSTIFDVFLSTQSKLAASSGAAAPSPSPSPKVDKVQAEALKAKANKAIAAKNYPEAISLYSQAIEWDGANAIYYANRAAAYSQSGDHTNAAVDAEKALVIDPSYSKAYSRLGHAYFCLGSYEESVKAYKSGLALDPSSDVMKNSLNTAQKKLDEAAAASSSLEQPAKKADAGLGGFPGMPGMPGGGGPGGMDFASMMSDPNFMSMASKMMSNPAFAGMAQNMMKDPNALQNLMSNPELMKMAGSMMGGANGGGGQ